MVFLCFGHCLIIYWMVNLGTVKVEIFESNFILRNFMRLFVLSINYWKIFAHKDHDKEQKWFIKSLIYQFLKVLSFSLPILVPSKIYTIMIYRGFLSQT